MITFLISTVILFAFIFVYLGIGILLYLFIKIAENKDILLNEDEEEDPTKSLDIFVKDFFGSGDSFPWGFTILWPVFITIILSCHYAVKLSSLIRDKPEEKETEQS